MNTRSLAVAILILVAMFVTNHPRVSSTASAADNAVLTVISGLPNQGANNAIAGANVLLLKESFEDLMRKSGLFSGQASTWQAWKAACANRTPACVNSLRSVQAAAVTDGVLDATGSVVLEMVDPGIYYLGVFAFNPQSAQVMVWDVRVDLKPGENSITLDQRNMVSFDARVSRQAASTPSSRPGAVNPEGTNVRPSGPKNSVLALSATDGPQKPVARTAFYLLDDDAEKILVRAGFKQQMLLGKPLPPLNGFEFVARMVALQKNDPRFAILKGLSGESLIPPEVEQQYNLGLQALSQHLVATANTNASGRAILPAVPAGTYYLYGTTSEFVKVGDVVTVDTSTITPTVTSKRAVGYDSATIWNLKVTVNAGRNSVALTRTNAVFVTGR